MLSLKLNKMIDKKDYKWINTEEELKSLEIGDVIYLLSFGKMMFLGEEQNRRKFIGNGLISKLDEVLEIEFLGDSLVPISEGKIMNTNGLNLRKYSKDKAPEEFNRLTLQLREARTY